MIARFISLLLTPLDYLADAYLVARGRALAPDPRPVKCAACDAGTGECDPGCPFAAAALPAACDGCGAGIGVDCAATCPFMRMGAPLVPPPPLALCCYCGKPAPEGLTITTEVGRGDDVPICHDCDENDPPSMGTVRAKIAADRARDAGTAS